MQKKGYSSAKLTEKLKSDGSSLCPKIEYLEQKCDDFCTLSSIHLKVPFKPQKNSKRFLFPQKNILDMRQWKSWELTFTIIF